MSESILVYDDEDKIAFLAGVNKPDTFLGFAEAFGRDFDTSWPFQKYVLTRRVRGLAGYRIALCRCAWGGDEFRIVVPTGAPDAWRDWWTDVPATPPGFTNSTREPRDEGERMYLTLTAILGGFLVGQILRRRQSSRKPSTVVDKVNRMRTEVDRLGALSRTERVGIAMTLLRDVTPTPAPGCTQVHATHIGDFVLLTGRGRGGHALAEFAAAVRNDPCLSTYTSN